MDQQFGQRDSVFFRYSYVYTHTKCRRLPSLALPTVVHRVRAAAETESQNGALGWTHISRHIWSTRRASDTAAFMTSVFSRTPTCWAFRRSMASRAFRRFRKTAACRYSTMGSLASFGANTTLPSDKASDVTQVTENLSIDRDRHQIRTGFEFQHIAFPLLTPTQPRGNFTNNGIFTSVVSSTDNSTDRAQFIIDSATLTLQPPSRTIWEARTA